MGVSAPAPPLSFLQSGRGALSAAPLSVGPGSWSTAAAFVDGEFCEFYPERESAELWMLATDHVYRFLKAHALFAQNRGNRCFFPVFFHFYRIPFGGMQK